MKLGAARSKAPSAWRLVDAAVDKTTGALSVSLDRDKLRAVSPPPRPHEPRPAGPAAPESPPPHGRRLTSRSEDLSRQHLDSLTQDLELLGPIREVELGPVANDQENVLTPAGGNRTV